MTACSARHKPSRLVSVPLATLYTASVTGTTRVIFDPVGSVRNQGVTTPYVVQIGVDTQPASCLSTVGITLYGGVRAIKC